MATTNNRPKIQTSNISGEVGNYVNAPKDGRSADIAGEKFYGSDTLVHDKEKALAMATAEDRGREAAVKKRQEAVSIAEKYDGVIDKIGDDQARDEVGKLASQHIGRTINEARVLDRKAEFEGEHAGDIFDIEKLFQEKEEIENKIISDMDTLKEYGVELTDEQRAVLNERIAEVSELFDKAQEAISFMNSKEWLRTVIMGNRLIHHLQYPLHKDGPVHGGTAKSNQDASYSDVAKRAATPLQDESLKYY